MSITFEEFNMWKALPTTQAFYHLLQDEIEAIKQDLISERLILDANGGQLRLSHLLGEKKSFETIISLSYEEIIDDKENATFSFSSIDSSGADK